MSLISRKDLNGELFHQFFQSIGVAINRHPALFTAGIVGVTAFTIPGILAALGFSAGGVVAGSFAAAWQASIGNVVSGSLFSIIQALTATHKALIIGSGIGIAAAAFIAITFIIQNEWEKDDGLRRVAEIELQKFGENVGRTAGDIGGKVVEVVNSEQFQGGLRHVGNQAGHLAGQVTDFINSEQFQGGLQEAGRQAGQVAEGVAAWWMHWAK